MANETVRYVAGFLFSDELDRVALVRKVRPAWQAGKLNGVGGHIEAGETAAAAMRREFREETGVDVDEWEHFATVGGDGFEVVFFRATDSIAVNRVRQTTDEPVEVHPTHAVPRLPTIPNLRWLVPMAHDASRHDWPYSVTERSPAPSAT